MPAVLELRGVTKVYRRGQPPANDDVSMAVEAGEIFGILGDNGAGKSTAIRQLVGLVAPTAGEVRFRGAPIASCTEEVTLSVGYMPQSAFALNSLKVREAIYFTSRFRGLSRAAARDEVPRLLGTWGITDVADRVAKQLSGGQRRLLQLAVSMAGSPSVLILDEPTNDLDPLNRQRVWNVLRAARDDGATIVFVTHDAIEAEKVIDRVAIMRRGRIVATGAPRELKAGVDSRYRLEVSGAAGSAPLPGLADVVELSPGRWRAMLDRAEVGRVLAALDVLDVDDVKLSSATLEDLFIHYATAD